MNQDDRKQAADGTETAGDAAIHRIRLRGPWIARWLGSTAAAAGQEHSAASTEEEEPQRVRVPIDWQSTFGPRMGRARFERSFHCPTGLEPEDRVIVVLEKVSGRGRVLVDGRLAADIDSTTGPDFAVEITPLLAPACRLEVELEPLALPEESCPAGLLGPVTLEIHSPGNRS